MFFPLNSFLMEEATLPCCRYTWAVVPKPRVAVRVPSWYLQHSAQAAWELTAPLGRCSPDESSSALCLSCHRLYAEASRVWVLVQSFVYLEQNQ